MAEGSVGVLHLPDASLVSRGWRLIVVSVALLWRLIECE